MSNLINIFLNNICFHSAAVLIRARMVRRTIEFKAQHGFMIFLKDCDNAYFIGRISNLKGVYYKEL